AGNLLAQAADRPWGEPAARESPLAGVLRGVHVEQVAHFTFGKRGELAREDGDPRRVQEDIRLPADLDDIGVLGDGPERLHVWPLIPEDRRVVAEPGPLRMRIAVALGVLRAHDVECRWIKVACGHWTSASVQGGEVGIELPADLPG